MGAGNRSDWDPVVRIAVENESAISPLSALGGETTELRHPMVVKMKEG
jgi:hypothetical protein